MEKADQTRVRRKTSEKIKAQASPVAEKLAQAVANKLAGPEEGPSSQQNHKERIGRMLITANEAAPISHTGKSALEAVRRFGLDKVIEKPKSDTPSGSVSRAELLNLSEQIIVDGSSLRQIYESHLIGERGLRRLVAEHMQGGDLRKALHHEVVEREVDFERDPLVRDMIPQDGLTHGGGANAPGKEALDKLLERAAVNISDGGEETAFLKARALYEASQLQQHKQQRRLIDFALAAAIAILVALIIALIMSRN